MPDRNLFFRHPKGSKSSKRFQKVPSVFKLELLIKQSNRFDPKDLPSNSIHCQVVVAVKWLAAYRVATASVDWKGVLSKDRRNFIDCLIKLFD